jgi:AcrR family transcriptional regulator
MSVSYEEVGRRQQKARTRAALVAAARDLLSQGVYPTVEQAAEAAAVSRATAYRYFPNQSALLVAAHPEIEARSLLGDDPPREPEARLDAVVTALARMFLEAETTYRAMLRLALDPSAEEVEESDLRKGLRLDWIGEALAPLEGRLPAPELDRLVHAVAAVAGIEALVTLTDLVRLPRREAVEVMRWSARALLRSALAEAEGAEPGHVAT